MDIFLRVIAIFIEVVILAAVMYCLLTGVRLTVFDLGMGLKYKRVVALVLLLVGFITVFFFIAHLTSFYPVIEAG